MSRCVHRYEAPDRLPDVIIPILYPWGIVAGQRGRGEGDDHFSRQPTHTHANRTPHTATTTARWVMHQRREEHLATVHRASTEHATQSTSRSRDAP